MSSFRLVSDQDMFSAHALPVAIKRALPYYHNMSAREAVIAEINAAPVVFRWNKFDHGVA